MYVYLRTEFGLWTVGFYKPDGTWEAQSDHDNEKDAIKTVILLNGGDPEKFKNLEE